MAKSWVKKLDELATERGDMPPEFNKGDWFTIKEAKENFGYGDNRTRNLINKGIESGEIEIYKGSQWQKEKKQLVRQVWYRFKNRN